MTVKFKCQFLKKKRKVSKIYHFSGIKNKTKQEKAILDGFNLHNDVKERTIQFPEGGKVLDFLIVSLCWYGHTS